MEKDAEYPYQLIDMLVNQAEHVAAVALKHLVILRAGDLYSKSAYILCKCCNNAE